MTLEEQLALCDRYADKAYVDVLRYVKRNRESIVAAARAGFIVGYEQYGDANWRKDFDALLKDMGEEIRDAVVYGVMIRSKGWHI